MIVFRAQSGEFHGNPTRLIDNINILNPFTGQLHFTIWTAGAVAALDPAHGLAKYAAFS